MAAILRSIWIVPYILMVVALLNATPTAKAEVSNVADELSAEEIAYHESIAMRATAIVDVLDLDDPTQQQRVVDLVAEQYRTLRDIHDQRDRAIELLHGEGAEVAQKVNQQRMEADHTVVVAHRQFVARLEAGVDPEQVNQIKDGMTYGVVPLTYQAYMELLPSLLDEEKQMIKAWLLEAREYAMDGGSSEEKHAWFGKYKGRINNFLSARGYDLKQAEKALELRRKSSAGK